MQHFQCFCTIYSYYIHNDTFQDSDTIRYIKVQHLNNTSWKTFSHFKTLSRILTLSSKIFLDLWWVVWCCSGNELPANKPDGKTIDQRRPLWEQESTWADFTQSALVCPTLEMWPDFHYVVFFPPCFNQNY